MKKKDDKKVTVMIGGGDESIFVKINKGEKIYSNDSHFIAGEILEENKKNLKSVNAQSWVKKKVI